MSMSVRINNKLYEEAKNTSKDDGRTLSGQIEFWVKIGNTALDNPYLPIALVRD